MEKKTGDFYTGVRERGLLNQMLEGPAQAFQAAHPDMKCKWEHAPPNGDLSMVTMREAQGFRVVLAEELANQTASSQRSGMIRRGDLVLMAAPTEVYAAILEADALAADEDYKMPERTYKEHLEDTEFKLASGETRRGKGFGEIRRSYEETPIPQGTTPASAPQGGDKG